ncbi:hypothetical protein [Streptomyces luteireticuli]|uniref:hypothetical protein n=1 Tax=Streptomyces luteireticuli TaxID=173858 RepID=UPI003555DC75
MTVSVVAPSEAAYCLFLIVGKGDRVSGTETDYVWLYLTDEPAHIGDFVPAGWYLLADESTWLEGRNV